MPRGTKKVLPELQWFSKKRKLGEGGSSAVSVVITSSGKNLRSDRRRLTFIFRDKMYENFNSKYVTFAVMKNRIYFRGVEPRKGYSVTVKGLNGYAQCIINLDELKQLEPFIGDYSLKYDDFYELYYVEKEDD